MSIAVRLALSNPVIRKKISDAKKGKKRKPFTDIAKQHMGDSRRGKKRAPFTDAHKKAISDAKRGIPAKNRSALYGVLYHTKRELQAGQKMSDACEICRTPLSMLKRKLYYDHDHKTNKFRGWLCSACNLLLGCAKDDIQVLEQAILYLNNKK